MSGYCPRCNQPFDDYWDIATKRCKVCGLTKRELLSRGGPIPKQAQAQATALQGNWILQGYYDVTGQGLLGADDGSI